ncbi:MAG: ABC transporter ATP-binding protein [Chloroflexota bacterium]|nr:ABC transporter ATP-binding protein [Chloroflexota bacterium]
MNDIVLETQNLVRRFVVGDHEVTALNGVSLVVNKGEFISITGPSGSGKTSLLNILGCLDREDSGVLLFEGRDVSQMSDRCLDDLRLRKMGFVFQTFNLFPTLSALENVMFPMGVAGVSRNDQMGRAEELLDIVGLSLRMRHRPRQLSAGENQRVSIARSLANNPVLLLADEPTGNLDSKNTKEITDLFKRINQAFSTTIIMVTHDLAVASGASRQIRMMDGKIT